MGIPINVHRSTYLSETRFHRYDIHTYIYIDMYFFFFFFFFLNLLFYQFRYYLSHIFLYIDGQEGKKKKKRILILRFISGRGFPLSAYPYYIPRYPALWSISQKECKSFSMFGGSRVIGQISELSDNVDKNPAESSVKQIIASASILLLFLDKSSLRY